MPHKNQKNHIPKAGNDHFVFFGSSHFSVRILEELQKRKFFPKLVITTPDKPQGRKLLLTPPPVKLWAEKNHIPCLQLETLKENEFRKTLEKGHFAFFVVASYGKILPEEILKLPEKGTLNVHPSLLPRLRGATPIESAILYENETGVSIMLIDEEMDHGPILLQKKLKTTHFPTGARKLEELLAEEGGKLLSNVIPLWLEEKIMATPQKHDHATYTKKLKKAQAEINFKDSPEKNYRKILAYEKLNPFFFTEVNGKKTRVIIKKAHLKDNEILLDRVLPEGKNMMSSQEFIRWQEKRKKR